MAISYQIRRAKLSDCKEVWMIRNDGRNRLFMNQTDHISFVRHKEWYSGYLKESDLFFVLCQKGVIGYLRFDTKSDGLHVAIAIDGDSQGRGLGTVLLGGVLKDYEKELKDKKIFAEVKKENVASNKLFLKLDFKKY